MIDINRTTQKVQEALQGAQAQALRLGHAEIDGEHLLLALCEQEDGLTPASATEDGGCSRCPGVRFAQGPRRARQGFRAGCAERPGLRQQKTQ